MKAQADIISAVMIIIMAMSIASFAIIWGKPLIEKRQDMSLVERVYKSFDRDNSNSLTRKIEYVAKYGGEQTFSIDADGLWTFYPCADQGISACVCTAPACPSENNSVQFSFLSKVSNVAVDRGWIPGTCGSPPGLVGADTYSVICGKAETAVEGDFKLTYKTWFRELDENPADPNTKGYKIILSAPTGVTGSTGRSIRISRGTISPQTVGGKTLITTEIKIFLV